MQQGTTTSEMYCETLPKKKMCSVIQNKTLRMLTSSVVPLHVSAHPHTAAHTQAMLKYFNWELFGHPPYSPHLAPSDYHLFTYLKNWMGSQSFNNNELTKGIKTWMSSWAADFSDRHTKTYSPT
jgi:histone-lysine N-methyltransferase SETMAR